MMIGNQERLCQAARLTAREGILMPAV